MSLLNKKSTIHNHLSRPAHKKPVHTRDKVEANNAGKVQSDFGKLQIGKEDLSVHAAYKPIFGL